MCPNFSSGRLDELSCKLGRNAEATDFTGESQSAQIPLDVTGDIARLALTRLSPSHPCQYAPHFFGRN